MSNITSQPKATHKKANQYDDPDFDYVKYWHRRRYEHEAEVLAIRKLLGNRHFNNAVDVGGGYGRLTPVLKEFANHVTLAEPSQKQLDMAKEFLEDHQDIKRKLLPAHDLKFDEGSVDLLTLIRVMHHLPDPMPEFNEIARVLSRKGYAIIEVANYMHARNRAKHLLKGQRLPKEPVDIRSRKNRNAGTIPFVNHNPHTVVRQLAHAGLKVERILSVSNLRSTGLKNVLPTNVMIAIEGLLQPALAKVYFGPSIFFLVKKAG